MARFGNAGGRGRRLTDFEDQPLTDAPLEVTKGAGGFKDAVREVKNAVGTRNSARRLLDDQATAEAGPWGGRESRQAEMRLAQRDVRRQRAVMGGAGAAGVAAVNSELIARRQRKGKLVVAKAARYYDPEHRRQRRLGMAQAGLAGGGLVATGLGIRGAAKTTRLVRGKHPNVVGSAKEVKELSERAGRSVSASPRDLALLGGGAAAITGAGVVRQRAEGRKLGIWR